MLKVIRPTLATSILLPFFVLASACSGSSSNAPDESGFEDILDASARGDAESFDLPMLIETSTMIAVVTPLDVNAAPSRIESIKREFPGLSAGAIYHQALRVEEVLYGPDAGDTITLLTTGPDFRDDEIAQRLEEGAIRLGPLGLGPLPSSRHLVFLRSTNTIIGHQVPDAYVFVASYEGALDVDANDTAHLPSFPRLPDGLELKVSEDVMNRSERAVPHDLESLSLASLRTTLASAGPSGIGDVGDSLEATVAYAPDSGTIGVGEAVAVSVKGGAASQIIFVTQCTVGATTAGECDISNVATIELDESGSGSVAFTPRADAVIDGREFDCRTDKCVIAVSNGEATMDTLPLSLG